MSLTPKQRRFVEEYLIDLNATAAAKRAGYSERTAQEQASRLLSKVMVQQAIADAMQARSRRTEIEADRVVNELAAIAFFDLRRLYREDGTLKPVHELDPAEAAAIASIEVFEERDGQGQGRRLTGQTRKVRLWDKLSALEKLGRHLGLFKDEINVNLQGPTYKVYLGVDVDKV